MNFFKNFVILLIVFIGLNVPAADYSLTMTDSFLKIQSLVPGSVDLYRLKNNAQIQLVVGVKDQQDAVQV